MREAIWKFPLEAAPLVRDAREQTYDIKMPMGAEIIRVDKDYQSGKGALWAIVRPNANKVTRRFHVCGTGWDFPDAPYKYVGTWQDGVYIWHVLEIL